jgi:hypothetical protein
VDELEAQCFLAVSELLRLRVNIMVAQREEVEQVCVYYLYIYVCVYVCVFICGCIYICIYIVYMVTQRKEVAQVWERLSCVYNSLFSLLCLTPFPFHLYSLLYPPPSTLHCV